jgi:hypothetical protein
MLEYDHDMNARGFIGHRVAPVIESAQQAGTFGKIPIEELLKESDTKRAPGSGYSRGEFEFEPASFACEEHGHEEPVDDRQAKMYASYFNAEVIAATRARAAVQRNAEKRWAAAIFNATTFASYTTAITHEWDDATNAVPLTDVETAANAIWAASGLWPNALIVNRKVFRNLRNCAQIIDRVKYSGFMDTRAGLITEAAIAQCFDLDHIIVAGGAKNSALEGQTASVASVWSDEYAMLCRVAETDDIQEPCIARTIHWGEDGSDAGGMMESYRDETVRSDIIRDRHDVDELIMHAASGHLFSNVTT